MNNNLNKIDNQRYITGFDGIRTIAVISVIFYHLFPNMLGGGYLGVPIFFTVSGYLITDLLIREYLKTDTIDSKSFFIRRMKRLYPALLTMLLLSSAYMVLFQKSLLNNLLYTILSNLFYVNNWWQIFNGSSYFEQFSSPSPFTHLWSLSVEAQYYLVWPILFILMKKHLKTTGKIVLSILIGSLISIGLMVFLYTPGVDPTRVYYGTDTRAFSILFGSALAFVWPSFRLKTGIPDYEKKWLNSIGIISLVCLMLSFIFLPANLSFVYYGGMVLVSILATLLVAITAHPGADLNRWLTNPLFDWVGKRSYGIYLYQYPVIIFYEAKIKNINQFSLVHSLIELAIILLISDLSYRFIEQPLRRIDYQTTKIFLLNLLKQPIVTPKKITFLFACIVVIIASYGIGVSQLEKATNDQQQLKKIIEENKKQADERKSNEKKTTSETTMQSSITETSTEIHESTEINYDLNEEEVNRAQKMEITAFGDSIILNIAKNLQEIFPNMIVDGEVGRQLYVSEPLIHTLIQENLLKQTVLVALGTNGNFTEKQFDDFMNAIGTTREVYWINVHVPTKKWETEVNDMLTKKETEHKNLTVIDWYNYSNSHAEWFYEDRVHPNIDGQTNFSSFIAKQLLKK